MADTRNRVHQGPLLIRAEAGQFFLPDAVAARIVNMRLTQENTLRSVEGPCPYVYNYGVGTPAAPYTYPGTMHGIFHARVFERDILLAHSGAKIIEYHGWTRTWADLLTATGNPAAVIDDDNKPRYPTQFEFTGTGIVIIPQGCGAYYYDGTVILPLGYSQQPAAPKAYGPNTGLANSGDYFHDALQHMGYAMNPDFRFGRIGTLRSPADPTNGQDTVSPTNTGCLEQGSYRGAVQWIDYFGNVSALSGRSSPVTLRQQNSYDSSTAPGTYQSTDYVLKELAWGVVPGPIGTVGRILCRTRDELHAGTLNLFEIPANSADGALAFATIPDNETVTFPDNCADSWLVRSPVAPMVVRPFQLCRMAFGRLWTANWDDEPHRLQPSVAGRFGTFLAEQAMYPDPAAEAITGLWRSAKGLLVFTELSMYLVEQNETGGALGSEFSQSTVSPTIGCVAPDSIQTLPDGSTVWLGRDGFFVWDGTGQPQPISHDISVTLRDINRARRMQACSAVDPLSGEYRCWVPMSAGRDNALCFTFDYRTKAFRERTDVTAAVAVCVTRDHRHYTLVAGKSTDSNGNSLDGVWVLDCGAYAYTPQARSAIVETCWLTNAASQDRKSPKRVRLWLRESADAAITIETMRDWRSDVVDTMQLLAYDEADIPSFWDETLYDETAASWKRRRPTWKKIDIELPSCEVFKLRFSSQYPWEFIGMMVDEVPQATGGARLSP